MSAYASFGAAVSHAAVAAVQLPFGLSLLQDLGSLLHGHEKLHLCDQGSWDKRLVDTMNCVLGSRLTICPRSSGWPWTSSYFIMLHLWQPGHAWSLDTVSLVGPLCHHETAASVPPHDVLPKAPHPALLDGTSPSKLAAWLSCQRARLYLCAAVLLPCPSQHARESGFSRFFAMSIRVARGDSAKKQKTVHLIIANGEIGNSSHNSTCWRPNLFLAARRAGSLASFPQIANLILQDLTIFRGKTCNKNTGVAAPSKFDILYREVVMIKPIKIFFIHDIYI